MPFRVWQQVKYRIGLTSPRPAIYRIQCDGCGKGQGLGLNDFSDIENWWLGDGTGLPTLVACPECAATPPSGLFYFETKG